MTLRIRMPSRQVSLPQDTSVQGVNLDTESQQAIGIGSAKKEAIQNRWFTADDVEHEVASLGFRSTPRPVDFCEQLSVTDLTSADPTSYTETFLRWNGWFAYNNEELAKVSIRVAQMKNAIEEMEASMYRRIQTKVAEKELAKKPSADEFKRYCMTNPEYQDLVLMEQRLEQKKTLLAAHNKSLEQGLRIISRQIEVRKMEAESVRIESNTRYR